MNRPHVQLFHAIFEKQLPITGNLPFLSSNANQIVKFIQVESFREITETLRQAHRIGVKGDKQKDAP